MREIFTSIAKLKIVTCRFEPPLPPPPSPLPPPLLAGAPPGEVTSDEPVVVPVEVVVDVEDVVVLCGFSYEPFSIGPE